VRDAENGLLVPPRDPERLAAAARRIIDEPELARRLSGAALAEAREHYRLEDGLARLRREIESVLAAYRS
jgi:glycosyltransferase involved in cell wall biosynthesis